MKWKYMQYGHWKYHTEFSPIDYHGFTYLIERLDNGKKYIGKKNFKDYKGKESNWKSYMSSSKILKKEIKELGTNNFSFTILGLYTDNESMSIAEVDLQRQHDVLHAVFPNGEKMYYNMCIHFEEFNTTGRKRPAHEVEAIKNRTTGRKWEHYMSQEQISKQIERSVKHITEYNKRMRGITFDERFIPEVAEKRRDDCGKFLRNKTYEEAYGIEKAKEIKKKRSEKSKGLNAGVAYEDRMGIEKAIEAKKKKSESMKKTLSERRDRVFELITWWMVANTNPTFLCHLRPLAAILENCQPYLVK